MTVGSVVATVAGIPYSDTDDVERVLPAGTVGIVEGWDEKTGEITVLFGDNSFHLDDTEVQRMSNA